MLASLYNSKYYIPMNIDEIAYDVPSMYLSYAFIPRPHVHDYSIPVFTDAKSTAFPVRIAMVCKCGDVLERNSF